MGQIASARGSNTGPILKESRLCVLSYLVVPSRTGIMACLCFICLEVFPGLGWLSWWFLSEAYEGKSTGCSSLGQEITVRTRNRFPDKSLKRKRVGKEICERIRTFKSSLIYWGMEKSMCINRAECMFRKGLRRP